MALINRGLNSIIGRPKKRAKARAFTKEFVLETSKAKWGDRYTYIFPESVKNAAIITVICPDHGPSQISARAHTLSKFGCTHCFEENEQRGEVRACHARFSKPKKVIKTLDDLVRK